jgi:very-short-patch-repair endonuclease
MTRRTHSEETKAKMRAWHLGKKISPEQRAKTAETLRAYYAEHPEACAKISDSLRGRTQTKATLHKRSAAMRDIFDREPERRAVASAQQLGHPVSEVTRQAIRRAKLHEAPRPLTNIERSLKRQFNRRGLRFEMFKMMFDRFRPDFVFEEARLIVEADCVYWHSFPRNRIRDRLLDKTAVAAGWSVAHFTDRQIKTDAAGCAEVVAAFVR